MFEKGRGNDHKELLVIYSADTIRLGSCYCCNTLMQKSTACCTVFVNIPLLSCRLYRTFALSLTFTVTLCPFSYPYQELYQIIRNSLPDRLGGMFLNWDRREAQNVLILVLILCMCQLSWIYRSETFPQKETMKIFMLKCIHMTCISMGLGLVFFISSLFYP